MGLRCEIARSATKWERKRLEAARTGLAQLKSGDRILRPLSEDAQPLTRVVLGAYDAVVLVNVPGPSEPTDAEPAAQLIAHPAGASFHPIAVLLHAGPDGEGAGPGVLPHRAKGDGPRPMFGGSLVVGDSRLRDSLRGLGYPSSSGAVPLHDHFENWENYKALSI